MTERPVRSTYRLQLTSSFGFGDAAGLVDYVADLGVSHLYLSPILQAVPGSEHGYDVADPTRVSEELGGEEGLRALAERAHAAGLGLVVDVVPNHLGVSAETPLWEELLAHGPSGDAAAFFDVDWQPPLPGAAGKVLLPVLGDQYGRILESGELVVDGGRVRYHEHSFPLSVDSRAALERAGGELDRRRLHALLEQQHYRLLWWRAGPSLVNYRRFFAINELAGVRVEDERVFDHTHRTILRLVAEGVIDGLRIDHPDGLRDPARYVERLAARTGGVWTVVEKILSRPHGASHEVLPPSWPVAGTTGYEFANLVLGLFVDAAAAPVLDALDAELGGAPASYDEQVLAAKREVVTGELATDVQRLGRRLWALTQQHPEIRDVDEAWCRAVVARTLQCLPVYRTYVDPVTGTAGKADVALAEAAVADAQRLDGLAAAPEAAPPTALFSFLADVLLGRAGISPDHLDLLARFQQLSGAVTAKAVEDTVFYRYRRLLAVNEVGGHPAHLGVTLEDFHAANTTRPHGAMVTTMTHDTKRGEDVRLRMAALSELPGRWAAAARRWRRDGTDPQAQQLVLQTLVGTWPISRGRLVAYVEKALREAGEHTDWYDPDADYEREVTDYCDALLADEAFIGELEALVAQVRAVTAVTGLAQTLLRCAVPGVPDTYQGTELWDDSLVDPDNRRPVDFAARRRLLDGLADADPVELWDAREDGRVKLWVLSRALRARMTGPYLPLEVTGRFAQHVVAFARGDGAVVVTPRLPVAVMGDQLEAPLGERWADTRVALPAGEWKDVLSGGKPTSALAALLRVLPVALLQPR